MTRVFLTDPFPVVRFGIRNYLENKEFRCIGEAASLRETNQALAREIPDILITEILFPGENPWTFLQHIRTLLGPEAGLIVFSASTDFSDISRAATWGVDDYLPKTLSCRHLEDALRAFLERKSPISLGLMLQQATQPPPKGHAASRNLLTDREIQVLRLIALGLSNKKIGILLQISEQTVKEHVRNILRKTSMMDRTQAAVWGLRNGIIRE